MVLGTGWLRDLPDLRDWDAMVTLGPMGAQNTFGMEASGFDGRKYCSPIENQGRLGSCTAQAVVALAEYMERRLFGRHIDASRLFVYYMARKLDNFHGDTGAHIRTAMKAFRLLGAPPERYWPYDIEKFDEEPSRFAYALAQNWQALCYHRIDIRNRSRDECLDLMRGMIARWLPVVLGFRVYSYGTKDGEFPMPSAGDKPRGGHAVAAVGYDDNYKIGNSEGALLIRNSWGTGWGQKGYGWLPYDYVREYLSSDFWVLTRKECFMS
jgi:C1A family cysteine protease